MYDIPVVFLNYTRPENTCIIADILKEINLKKLYLISDFPEWKHAGELNDRLIKVNNSLEHFNKLDQTEILIKKCTTNKGSFSILEHAIRWAFEKEDFIILLENDTIPCIEFFNFCNIAKTLIGKNNIACGTGFQLSNVKANGYTTSSLCLPFWGSILEKNETLLFLDNIKSTNAKFNYDILPYDQELNKFYTKIISYARDNFEQNQYKNIDMDTFVFMHLLLNNKTAILPGHNLISYRGFDSESRDIDTNLTVEQQKKFTLDADNTPITNTFFQNIEFENSRALQFRKMQSWIT